MFKNHPFGRVMLDKILEAGLPPPTIIIEEGGALAKKRCSWYTRVLKEANRLPPSTRELLFDRGVSQDTIVELDSMNGAASQHAVREAQLDVMILGGAGIVDDAVFELPQHGTLNVHPGFLPLIRGSLPVAWSLVKNIPVGCTLHRVSNVLDGGEWIERDQITWSSGTTFDEIVYKSCALAGTQAARALSQLAETKTLVSTPLPTGFLGPNFKWSDNVEQKARDMLAGRIKNAQGVSCVPRGEIAIHLEADNLLLPKLPRLPQRVEPAVVNVGEQMLRNTPWISNQSPSPAHVRCYTSSSTPKAL